MKRISLFLFLAISAKASITVTVTSGLTTAACGSSSGTACTIAQPTNSGDSLIVDIAYVVGNAPTGMVGGCTSTWLHPSNTATIAAFGRSVDIWYCLNSSNASTVVGTCVSNECSGAVMVEGTSSNSGSWILDAGTTPTGTTSSGSGANPSGVALTLAGANDLIVQGAVSATGITAVSPYTNLADMQGAATSRVAATLLNTTSGSAPTWTMTSGAFAGNAIALTEPPGGGGSGEIHHKVTGGE